MIQKVENEELQMLRDYFEKLSNSLHTGQLRWYFDIRLFDITDTNTVLNELINSAYPTALPEKAQIATTTFYDFQESLDYCFTTGYFGERPVKWFIRKDKYFTYLFEECLQSEDAAIYEYKTQEPLDPLGAGILGKFTFIFLNHNQGRFLILHGGDCD